MHFTQWKQRSADLRADALALYFVWRDPRTPFAARAVALATVAYALSPIDLIPDFIPVLGLLDDLVIVPAGVRLALRLVPPAVMAAAREQAAREAARPGAPGLIAAAVIVAIWLTIVALTAWRVLACRGGGTP